MQGNCTSGRTDVNSSPAELKRLLGDLSGDPVPLKPFQCLLVTNANTLFVEDASAFWMDNLYIGVSRPRSQHSSISASILSTGHSNAESPSRNVPAKLKSVDIFTTNVTVHGHGLETFPARVMSLTNTVAKVSALCQGGTSTMLAYLNGSCLARALWHMAASHSSDDVTILLHVSTYVCMHSAWCPPFQLLLGFAVPQLPVYLKLGCTIGADSIFVELSGRDPPILVASGAYSTCVNCMFRNIRLPRSGLVDISNGGSFTCINCHFSNVSTGQGIVETGNNIDYASYLYSYEYGQDTCMEDPDGLDLQDIALYPAPEEAVLAYGSDYFIANETIRDCVYLQTWAGDHALPKCPQESVEEPPERLTSASRRDDAYTDPAWAHEYTEDYAQHDGDRDLNRRTSNQYYEDSSQMPSREDAGYPSACAPGPQVNMSYADDFVASLGEQLSIDHEWLQAVMRVCFSITASVHVCQDLDNVLYSLPRCCVFVYLLVVFVYLLVVLHGESNRGQASPRTTMCTY